MVKIYAACQVSHLVFKAPPLERFFKALSSYKGRFGLGVEVSNPAYDCVFYGAV